jgi:hypothetical protein
MFSNHYNIFSMTSTGMEDGIFNCFGGADGSTSYPLSRRRSRGWRRITVSAVSHNPSCGPCSLTTTNQHVADGEAVASDLLLPYSH